MQIFSKYAFFFLQLFLLHMDDITPNATNQQNGINQPIGCSTICVNNKDCVSEYSSGLFNWRDSIIL